MNIGAWFQIEEQSRSRPVPPRRQGRIPSQRERTAWISRYCCDMTAREIFEPQQYHKVLPYNRIFVEPKKVNEAVGRISLVLGG